MGIEGNVVVIGASGSIGLQVCRLLRRNDVATTGTARFRFPGTEVDLKDLGVETLEHDAVWDDPMLLPDAAHVLFEVWDPAHLQERDDPAYRANLWKLNYDAVSRIALRYTLGRKRRPKPPAFLINGSTGNVYGSHPMPRSERDALMPDTEYGRSRLVQEKMLSFLAQQADTRAVHLRYFHANDEENGLLRDMAEAILSEESLGHCPDERVQVIALSDVARYTVLAMEKADMLPEAINVCHPRVWTRRSLALQLREVLGEGQVIFDAPHGGEERSVIGNPAKVIELFGEPQEDVMPLMEKVCAAALEDAAPEDATK